MKLRELHAYVKNEAFAVTSTDGAVLLSMSESAGYENELLPHLPFSLGLRFASELHQRWRNADAAIKVRMLWLLDYPVVAKSAHWACIRGCTALPDRLNQPLCIHFETIWASNKVTWRNRRDDCMTKVVVVYLPHIYAN